MQKNIGAAGVWSLFCPRGRGTLKHNFCDGNPPGRAQALHDSALNSPPGRVCKSRLSRRRRFRFSIHNASKTGSMRRHRGQTSTRRSASRGLAVALAALALGAAEPTRIAAQVAQGTPGPCQHNRAEKTDVGDDLYCITLIPTDDFREATGTVEMGRVRTPFTVAVTPDGRPRYQLRVSITGLPDPSTLGPYSSYVAWVTTPELDPMINLGEVANDRRLLPEVALNKFMILITAEESADVAERNGKLVLRGRSPSSLMESHDLMLLAPGAAIATVSMADQGHAAHGTVGGGGDNTWAMPPMHPAITAMAPGLMGLRPETTPFLPADSDHIPAAVPRELVTLATGDTLLLDAVPVRRSVRGRDIVMYGFNGQLPGPLLHVDQRANAVIHFTNNTPWPTAIHWHGLRLDNAFDGVPNLTQDPIAPGQSFTYEVTFPDAGIYWYHPHHREDVFQELGLYGNMIVQPADANYYGPVNREEVLMLDDLLLDDDGLVPFGTEAANYALMGRFGNVLLVNAEPDYRLHVRRNETVRFFLTNVSNTRTFNLSLPGAAMKVIASDIGKFEHEEWVENVVVAPAERYVVETLFAESGTIPLLNRVQGLDHRSGFYFPEVDTLGRIIVAEDSTDTDLSATFEQLRENADVRADIDSYRDHFDRPVDRELTLQLKVLDLPTVITQMMQFDYVYFNPVEWSGTMPMMNFVSSGEGIQWVLRDESTGEVNMDIDWSFEIGDVVKIRLHNQRDSFHAMQHPIHLHGQRFLVLEQDGVRNDNLVWKDTVLLPVGSTADILLDLTNPGSWMLHCHIAEHLAAGMKMVFEVH